MKVQEVMKPDVKYINFNSTVEEAAKMMERENAGGIPIEKDDKMVGMITDRDITVRVVAKGLDPKTTKVTDAMSEGISYCFDDESIEDVVRKMASVQHRRLPVVNRDKRLVGIVSLVDIARKVKNERLIGETFAQVSH